MKKSAATAMTALLLLNLSSAYAEMSGKRYDIQSSAQQPKPQQIEEQQAMRQA